MVSKTEPSTKAAKQKGMKNDIDAKITKVKKNKHLVKIIDKPKDKKKLKIEAIKAIVNDEKIVIKKKKTKMIMPKKYVTESIVDSLLNALDQVIACTMKKNALFEDEQNIFAEIRCIKIPTTTGTITFLFPHSTAASTGEICLITPDLKKGKKIDHEPTIEYWQDILSKAGVTSVKTILPLRQLKVEYDQFELKRRLLTQHDFIMVDTRVLNHASHLLGQMFFKKPNMLIPVRINEKEKNVKKCIDIGLRTSVLRVHQGPTSVIVVGHTGMPKDKIKENILSLIQQLHKKYPGGDGNVRSISIKLPLSMPLPLYLTLRSSNFVPCAPKLKKDKPKNFRDVEDELSTIPDSKVRVAPDGTVKLKKEKQSVTTIEEESKDSEELSEDEESDNDK